MINCYYYYGTMRPDEDKSILINSVLSACLRIDNVNHHHYRRKRMCTSATRRTTAIVLYHRLSCPPPGWARGEIHNTPNIRLHVQLDPSHWRTPPRCQRNRDRFFFECYRADSYTRLAVKAIFEQRTRDGESVL